MSTSNKHLGGNTFSPATTTEAATEWTTEDFLAAEPYPMPDITEEMVRAFLDKTTPPTSKGGSTSPGGPPASGGGNDAQSAAQTLGYPYPPPFNQHEVLVPYTTYPYCTIGKLFFKQGTGSYVASASSIGKNGLWTAGHCVHSGNGQPCGWSTNMVFVPAYKDGAAPLGQFTARQLVLPHQLVSARQSRRTLRGHGRRHPQSAERTSIEPRWWAGSASRGTSRATRSGHSRLSGGPAVQRTAYVAGHRSLRQRRHGPGSPPTVGIGCSITTGCSGGPWVLGVGIDQLCQRPQQLSTQRPASGDLFAILRR